MAEVYTRASSDPAYCSLQLLGHSSNQMLSCFTEKMPRSRTARNVARALAVRYGAADAKQLEGDSGANIEESEEYKSSQIDSYLVRI